MYDYLTPPGVGDTFFTYVYDGGSSGLTNGLDYALRSVAIADGDFVMRAWSGLRTMVAHSGAINTYGNIQLYDTLRRALYSQVTSIPTRRNGQAVIPEVTYEDNGFIRFDLNNVLVASTTNGQTQIPTGQLVFYGVRRIRGLESDPAPSLYEYYEKPYMYPFSFTLDPQNSDIAVGTALGPLGPSAQFTIPVLDHDFELRRVEASTEAAQNVAIGLYNQSWRRTSNVPVVGTHFFHTSDPTANTQDRNSWPSPPLLYPVNTVIRFDLVSLAPVSVLPVTYTLNFVGVKRIPVR